jgi:two-component system, cell cycle sensor histidine kinase and response regulator CckA
MRGMPPDKRRRAAPATGPAASPEGGRGSLRLAEVADAIVESVRDPLLLLDGGLVIRDVNRAFCAYLGIGPQQAVGKTITALPGLIGASALLERALRAVLQSGEAFESVETEGEAGALGRRTLRWNGRVLRLDGKAPLVLASFQDQTRELEAQRALGAAEERFRRFFETSPIPKLIYDQERLAILVANPAAGRLFGRSEAELCRVTLRELVAGGSGPAVREWLDCRESAHIGVVDLRQRDGTVLELDVTVIPHPYDGRPAVQAVLRDVTEQNRAMRRLRESEENFRQMAESISQVFWMTDPAKARMLYISPAYEAIWGRPRGSVYADPRSWLDAIVPEDRERVAQAAASWQSAGTYDEVYRIARPDGAVRWIRDRAFPVRDESGAVIRVTGIAEDITESRQAEEELRMYRDFLEKAQEVASLGSWSYVFADGRVDWSNECCRIFGVPPGTVRSAEQFYACVHPDDVARAREVEAGAVEAGGYELEFRLIRPDGQTRTVQSRAKVLRDESGRPARLIGIVRDVTDERSARRKLEETERQLRQAQKMEAVGRLAGGVAHDFNNILTSILGLCELSIAALGDGHPVTPDIREVHACGLRAANLTQQLLAFSRRQIVSQRLLELDAVVLSLVKMLKRIIGEDVELAVEPGAAGAVVLADQGQLEQLVVNLAVNARDAMEGGGRLVISTVPEELEEECIVGADRLPAGLYLRLTVRDNGAGMDAETMSHLFEPFFTTKAPGKGTGLGLSTCYGIVRQSKGGIRCESAPGQGTAFHVLLPRAPCPAEPPKEESRRPLPRGTGTVLVVEDEEPVRRLASRVLVELGYTVLEAGDGAAGLELVRGRGGEVSLVITDMVMPQMGGRQFAEAARAARPGLRFIYMTGYTDDEVLRKGGVEPGAELLPKPFTASELAAAVSRALAAKG